MIGQQHQALVRTDDPNAIAPVWRTKLGSTRHLVIGVYVDGALATLTSPTLVIRRPEQDTPSAFPLTTHVGSSLYNLQREWAPAELAGLGTGRFIADIRGTIGGDEHVFPDAGYLVIEIQDGAG